MMPRRDAPNVPNSGYGLTPILSNSTAISENDHPFERQDERIAAVGERPGKLLTSSSHQPLASSDNEHSINDDEPAEID